MKKPKPKPKPKPTTPRDYVTRWGMLQTFHEQFQPVQQELAALVLEVRSYQNSTHNMGKSLARIESDLSELVRHFISELDPQGLAATHLKQAEASKPKPKTQKVQP